MCGRFRSKANLALIASDDEEWVECVWCLPEADRKHYGMEVPND